MCARTGINPSGESEAWIALVPEPGTALLVALGLTWLPRRHAARPGA
jgi:hypothetical protein